MTFARKIFLSFFFGGGGTCSLPLVPVSYVYNDDGDNDDAC